MKFPKVNEDFLIDISQELSVEDFLIDKGFEKSLVGLLNTPDNFISKYNKRPRNYINDENFDRILVDYKPVEGKEEDFKSTRGKIYTIVFNNKIVKIGQTSNTLKNRFSSYACGTRKYRERGTCSVTNYQIMESAYAVLMGGGSVEVYSYTVEPILQEINTFGESQKVYCKTEHHYESKLIELYVRQCGKRPQLSTNG